MKTNREPDGWFGVDSGRCVIGDPCYLHKFLAGKWMKVCAKFHPKQDAQQLSDKSDLPVGVLVGTGLGDGVYPVYVDYILDSMGYRRVAAVHIVFMEGPRALSTIEQMGKALSRRPRDEATCEVGEGEGVSRVAK